MTAGRVTMAYGFGDIVDAYRTLDIKKGDVIYVVSELWRLRKFDAGDDAESIAGGHYGALREAVGDAGTIVVSTASTNLCNTDIPFDVEQTPSHQMGIFSEYVRLLPDARRSFHPFISYAAVGPLAEAITANVSRHAFGPETPEGRLIDLGAKLVTIGMPPAPACSTIHHVEHVMGVPFRYVKEFSHPVVRGDEVAVEPFYMHVWYRDTGMTKDEGAKLFERMIERHGLDIKTAPLGRSSVWSYGMADFYRAACKVCADDIYVLCEDLPTVRPYTV